jgi:hypothetical protein
MSQPSPPRTPNSQSDRTRTTASLHHRLKATADSAGALLVHGFHYLALFAIGATTVWSAFADFLGMLDNGGQSFPTFFSCSSISKLAQRSESISRRPNFRCAI